MMVKEADDCISRDCSEELRKEIFHKEVLPHRAFLANYAIHLTGNREASNDLVQETLFKAFTNLHTLEPETHGRAWLYRIMKNTFINDHRRQRRAPVHVEFQDQEAEGPSASGSQSGSSDLNVRIERGALDDVVAHAVESLPAKIKNVLVLRDLENLPYQEIAETLNIPVGTVRSRLHRARSVLFTRLKAYAQRKGYSVSEDYGSTNLVFAG